MKSEYIYTSRQKNKNDLRSQFYEELGSDWEYKARKLRARRQRALKHSRVSRR